MESALRRSSAPGVADENRRLYPRRRVTFPATFSLDGQTTLPAFGLDLGGGGLRLFTRDPITTRPEKPVSLTAVIDGRKLHFKAVRRWSAAFEAPAGTRYRHGLALRNIKDGDWEFLMNLSLDASGLHRGVLSAVELGQMLSPDKQRKVAEELAAAGRLTYQPGSRLPLIEYAFDGYAMRHGVACYRFTVRSRVTKSDGPQEHRTAVLVAIEGDVVKLLED